MRRGRHRTLPRGPLDHAAIGETADPRTPDPERTCRRPHGPSPTSPIRAPSSAATSVRTPPSATRCWRRSASRPSRTLLDVAVPASHPRRHAAGPAAGGGRDGGARRAARPRRPQPAVRAASSGPATTARSPRRILRRAVLEDPGWYTAYTPYQPEISQGRLEALLVFQTVIADLTGCELAGASLLDEGTAAAEAIQLCRRARHAATGPWSWSSTRGCHPQTLAVVATRAEPLGVGAGRRRRPRRCRLRRARRRRPGPASPRSCSSSRPRTATLADDTDLIARCHEVEVPVVVATDLFACTLATPPGEQGADVVVGSAQRFGVPPMSGGPHAAFLATRYGVGTTAAGPPGRRLAGPGRPDRLPPGAADPRTAHPPGAGDLEHLHLAGAAGGRRGPVRGPPRPRGARPGSPVASTC